MVVCIVAFRSRCVIWVNFELKATNVQVVLR